MSSPRRALTAGAARRSQCSATQGQACACADGSCRCENEGDASGDIGCADLLAVHLKPSELVICREPCEVTTVLGSCVAVTMFSPRLGLAAICHAMLPAPGQGWCAGDKSHDPHKYVCFAIPAMAAEFKRAGARPPEIQVKMFGGANLIGRHVNRECPNCVGPANVRMARLLLGEEKLCLAAVDVGGCRGRKIVFNTASGRVLHKHLGEWRGHRPQRGAGQYSGALALEGFVGVPPNLLKPAPRS